MKKKRLINPFYDMCVNWRGLGLLSPSLLSTLPVSAPQKQIHSQKPNYLLPRFRRHSHLTSVQFLYILSLASLFDPTSSPFYESCPISSLVPPQIYSFSLSILLFFQSSVKCQKLTYHTSKAKDIHQEKFKI